MTNKSKIEEQIAALRKELRESVTKKKNGKQEDVAKLIRKIQDFEAKL